MSSESPYDEYIEQDMRQPRLRGVVAVLGVAAVTAIILFVIGNGFAAM